MGIDDHANNESPDGVNSRSQEVWGLWYIDDAMVRLLDKNPGAIHGCATNVGPGTSAPYSQAAGPIAAVHGRAGVESAAFHVLADPRPKRARSFARDRRRAPMSPRGVGGSTSAN